MSASFLAQTPVPASAAQAQQTRSRRSGAARVCVQASADQARKIRSTPALWRPRMLRSCNTCIFALWRSKMLLLLETLFPAQH